VTKKSGGEEVAVGVGRAICSFADSFIATDWASGVPADEVAIAGIPPAGVGVIYCPQSEGALVPHEESRKAVSIRSVVTRFIKKIIPLIAMDFGACKADRGGVRVGYMLREAQRHHREI
jgi:hypothetical protein